MRIYFTSGGIIVLVVVTGGGGGGGQKLSFPISILELKFKCIFLSAIYLSNRGLNTDKLLSINVRIRTTTISPVEDTIKFLLLFVLILKCLI